MPEVTMPRPVAWEYRDEADMKQPGSGTRLISFVRMTGMANERLLVYSDHAGAYTNARVKQALEEAADIADQHNAFPVYDAIRVLMPKEPE